MVRIKIRMMKRSILISIIALTSCKAVERYKASPAFAKDCATAFPFRDSTVYLPGVPIVDTVEHWIEVEIDCDSLSLKQTAQSTSIGQPITIGKELIRLPCPPSITSRQIDTLRTYREVTARLQACDDELLKERKESAVKDKLLEQKDAKIAALVEDRDKFRKRYRGLFWFVVLAVVGILGVKFRKGILAIFRKTKK